MCLWLCRFVARVVASRSKTETKGGTGSFCGDFFFGPDRSNGPGCVCGILLFVGASELDGPEYFAENDACLLRTLSGFNHVHKKRM